ncbi:MAG: HAMP domain-containing protein [Anaerolineae bacterium]|nr:HAMP domain-containing protein [Anaerolineae bacterium]
MRLNIKAKLLGGFLIVIALMVAMIVVVYMNVQTIGRATDRMLDEEFPVVDHAMNMMILARQEQEILTDLAISGSSEGRRELEELRKKFDAEVAAVRPLLEGKEVALMEEAAADEEKALATGLTMVDLFLAGKQEEGLVKMEEFDADFSEFIGQLEDIEASASAAMDEAMSTTDRTQASAVSMSVGIGLVAAIIAIVLGLYLSFQISRSVTAVAQAAEQIATVDMQTLATEMDALAQGDLNRSLAVKAQTLNITSQDEIGQMAQAFNGMIARLQEVGTTFTRMIAYLKEMGAAADTIARQDLTASVTPQSEKDVLGNSFAQMIANLRDVIGQVQESANQVAATSQQIGAASEQTGQAVQQVTATIQQVAQGVAQQTASTTDAAAQVNEFTKAVDGIAKGAQEQAQAVQNASGNVSQLAESVQQVAQGAQASASASQQAAETAQSGAQTVEQAVQAMLAIKDTVTDAGSKVEQMQKYSAQIGAIVETIDDIAEQTNLLALNAAIEAARAGEQGRGFAVVADEVRKLAERSGKATKEIAQLIQNVQQGTQEAVAAMNVALQKSEAGSSLAGQAGEALAAINEAVRQVSGQVQQIAQTAQEMSGASGELATAMERVSAVVEENTATSEELAASAGKINDAVESVASISEENSASAEEVSASAEEMSAQVEEMTASAQSLAALAEEMQAMVAQFNLGQAVQHVAAPKAVGRPLVAKAGAPAPANGHKREIQAATGRR